MKPYDIAVAFKPSDPGKGEALYRRSLYTYMRQTSPSPLLTTLNASKRDVCQVKIERTDSPLQGLVMLNSPQFAEASRVLAAQLVAKHGEDDRALVDEAFRRLTSRPPDEKERSILLGLLANERRHYQTHLGEAKALLSVGETPPSVSKLPAQAAAATALVSTLLNFDECVSKR